jgi:hypothetical protein
MSPLSGVGPEEKSGIREGFPRAVRLMLQALEPEWET